MYIYGSSCLCVCIYSHIWVYVCVCICLTISVYPTVSDEERNPRVKKMSCKDNSALLLKFSLGFQTPRRPGCAEKLWK